MNGILKNSLIRLRSSQPFNAIATSGLKGVFNATHTRPEFVIRHLHRLGRVEDQLPNGRTLKLNSRADDWVSNQIFWRGWEGYEPETATLFYKLASKSLVTIDIGAYVGFFTLLAAHANPEGKVVAVEPLAPVFKRLSQNVAYNDLNNVECINAALSDRAGSAEFFHIANGLPTSSSLDYEFMKATSDLVSSIVDVTTLDDLVTSRKLGRVDLVKIDTETTERDVLRGGIRLLERDRPDVFCEVLAGRAHERDLEEILAPLGYHYYLLRREGPERRTRIEGHPEWLNYLFSVKDIQANF